MKNVASGCDQCVWPVGVVAGCGHWVGHWMTDYLAMKYLYTPLSAGHMTFNQSDFQNSIM